MSLLKIRQDMSRKHSHRELTIIYSRNADPRGPMIHVRYSGWHDPYGPERDFKMGHGYGHRLSDAAKGAWDNMHDPFERKKQEPKP